LKQQSIFLPSNESAEPDEYNVNVVPRRGFHVAANGNPNNRGKPAAKPEEEEVRGVSALSRISY
jgi:hypothetical protein